jgi:ribosomal protein S27AE
MSLDLPPVRNIDGRVVWRVRVNRNERTCTRCGETTSEWFCPRCSESLGAKAASQALVPTVAYLKPNEYELA